jgi:monoamine oxidase
MSSSSISLLNPQSVAPSGPFSHGLVIPTGYNIIYTAGQIGTSNSQGTIPESYEEQVENSIKNLGDVLKAGGATPKDIIKLTYYIVDYGNLLRTLLLCSYRAVAVQDLELTRKFLV